MASDVWPLKRLRTTADEFGNYDVFISHRGPDTKSSFVDFLHDGLKHAGLRAFLDCVSIDKGQDSWTCIEHAIKTTPIAIVIFSGNYAQSEWCLKELHVMLEILDMKILPVFYKVEPWEVRFPEKGRLANGFAKLKQRHNASAIDEWKADLERASKLNGFEHREGDKRLEKVLVNEIVGKVFEWANKRLPLDVGQHVIGVDIVAQEIIQRLDQDKRVLMLGLWGVGGIGKSTLARELYNCLRRRFGASCFIEDVIEKVIRGGTTNVQSDILKDLCGNERIEIKDKFKGKVILEERLSNKKILMVLDNVCENDEMEYWITRKMLSEGSMCIVTSRNRRVFEKSSSFDASVEVYVHDVQELGYADSKHVFTSYAFGGAFRIKPELEELVVCITKACGGVPLVLKVCGALLKDEEDMDFWKDVLKRLECGSMMDDERIFDCLWISYDALPAEQKEMFLDIACALLGQSKDLAIHAWRCQGWFALLGVRSLVEKALVTVDENGCFGMHDHVRDMGREIARKEIACKGVIRRLWEVESFKILMEEEALLEPLQTLVISGTSKGEMERYADQLDLSHLKDLRILRCWLNPNATVSLPKNLLWFSWLQNEYVEDLYSWIEEPFGQIVTISPSIPQMNRLMILDLEGSGYQSLCVSIKYASRLEVLNLSNTLWLHWLPNAFGSLRSLRTLKLTRSKLKSLPESFGNLSSLDNLDMCSCWNLTKLPNSFGGLGTLRSLKLNGCKVASLPVSFGSLSSLHELDMTWCTNLTKLPDSFGGLGTLRTLKLDRSGVASLPESFGSLSSLENLNMWWCTNLTKLPDSFGDLETLRTLKLAGSGVASLPESFGSLSLLEVLDISWCTNLVKLPDSFGGLGTLRTLKLDRSTIASLPESYGSLSSLDELDMTCCTNLTKLPNSFGGLRTLRTLKLDRSAVASLSESFGSLSSLHELDMTWCTNLTKLPDSFGGIGTLRTLKLDRSGVVSLPESFGSLSSLENLNMWWCMNLTKLPDSFGGLETLRTLELAGSGVASLPESFGSLSLLEVLDISWCTNFIKLPDSFGGLGTLRTLKLDCSKVASLPKSFGSLSSLDKLDMSECTDLTKLPDSFGGLGTLKTLNLDRSRVVCLPESFGSLSSLEELDMSWSWKLNKLPDSFGGLGTLRTLKLDHSRVASLPKSFGSLSSLEKLDMSGCTDLTKLPDSFGSLGTLRTLKLDRSGVASLPESFGSLSSLDELDMSWCTNLTKLPDSFGSLGTLRTLKLDCSGLASLPESFGSLSSLDKLDMSGCTNLTKLPDSFGGLGTLRTLKLDRSTVASLPESLGSLTTLLILSSWSFEY